MHLGVENIQQNITSARKMNRRSFVLLIHMLIYPHSPCAVCKLPLSPLLSKKTEIRSFIKGWVGTRRGRFAFCCNCWSTSV